MLAGIILTVVLVTTLALLFAYADLRSTYHLDKVCCVHCGRSHPYIPCIVGRHAYDGAAT